MATFVVGMGVAALLAAVLHGTEAATWANSPDSRRHTRHQVCDALFAQRNNKLRPRKPLSGRAVAADGCFGGVERAVRADHRLSVRHDSRGLAAGKQRMAPEGLGAKIAYRGFHVNRE